MIPGREGFLASADTGRKEWGNRTWWDFQLRRELDRLADFNHAIRVREPLKMKDEKRRECLDVYLLARLIEADWTERHGLRMRNVRECVLNGEYRIGLREGFEG
jgi:hypothetical protein